ncbi:hypothetical protein [Gracilibacillus timonensis]|uniref:hypothetical protein n=1 Tax=Gracilibacillus timonensis TaxID=1816696 RepID=UPI00098F02AA|nr:hypothetical protein [Gracilibacillus timonensis]
MNQTMARSKKLGWGVLAEQAKWAVWFLVILCLIFLGLTLLHNYVESVQLDDFMINNNASAIFMLIVGILCTYSFLDYYVKLGITRRNFFKTALFASILLSILLSIAFILMIVLLEWIITVMGMAIPWTDQVSNSDIAQVLTQFISYTLIHFSYFLMGWMIGLGFYRFRWFIGLLFVAAGLLLASLMKMLYVNLFHVGPIVLLPDTWVITGFLAHLLSVLLFLTLIAANYRLIKDVTIRL